MEASPCGFPGGVPLRPIGPRGPRGLVPGVKRNTFRGALRKTWKGRCQRPTVSCAYPPDGIPESEGGT